MSTFLPQEKGGQGGGFDHDVAARVFSPVSTFLPREKSRQKGGEDFESQATCFSLCRGGGRRLQEGGEVTFLALEKGNKLQRDDKKTLLFSFLRGVDGLSRPHPRQSPEASGSGNHGGRDPRRGWDCPRRLRLGISH